MAIIGFGGKNILDIVKHRFLWMGLSAAMIIPAIGFMIYLMITLPTHSPLRLGIDFTGGTFIQYGFAQKFDVKDIGSIRKSLDSIDLGNAVIQIQKPSEILGKVTQEEALPDNQQEVMESIEQEINQKVISATSQKQDNTKTSEVNKDESKINNKLSEENKLKSDASKETVNKSIATTSSLDVSKVNTVVSMRLKFLDKNKEKELNQLLQDKYGAYSIIQVTAIGPSLGKELLRNAMIALLLVFGGIVLYLSFRFQFDYAICALITLFHDAIIVLGCFALFGILFNTEVDSMFVTAILTVIGFSVHDTIVVFDRIRENARFLSKKKSFSEICNDSVNQTLSRSINTSLTLILTLLCLYLFGGVTTRDFVLAMTIGVFVGTYSSIFNASVLLCYWRELTAPKKRTKRVAA